MIISVVFFFFFKQKTAYEMRISDWSSDVCSSDLEAVARELGQRRPRIDAVGLVDHEERGPGSLAQPAQDVVVERRGTLAAVDDEQDQVRLLRTGKRLARGCAGQVAAFQVGVLPGAAAGVDQFRLDKRRVGTGCGSPGRT